MVGNLAFFHIVEREDVVIFHLEVSAVVVESRTAVPIV
jgi:hypothetical protein